MKIAIYSPYLDTAGGGEKYILTIAEILSKKERVDILLDRHLQEIGTQKIQERNKSLHNIDFTNINFVKAPIGSMWTFFHRLFFFSRYDVLFYLTDGSLFLTTAKKNIIHFQVPFENNAAKGLWGNFKLKSWTEAIYNSYFTKEYVEKNWTIKGRVIYPPVNTHLLKSLNKKKQILSVGRFFGYDRAKKHELLIDIFKNMTDKKMLNNFSLHLAGGLGEGDSEYLKELKKTASGYKIFFYPNIELKKLLHLYSQTLIYWHATGFGEKDPKKFEHFGISTVEAMASGCVPVVVNLGGQSEIVEDEVSGFLWDTIKDMEKSTIELVSNKNLCDKMSRKAIERSKAFSLERFHKNLEDLVNEIS